MLRATLTHPKMYSLCDALGKSRPTILGYLTLLWDFTAEHAPTGDIGKWPDGVIERAMDWGGKPSDLVSVMVLTGWLDRDTVHRLVVHDWQDHCHGWVKAKVAKLGLRFIDPITDRESEGRSEDAEFSVASDSPSDSLSVMPSVMPSVNGTVSGSDHASVIASEPPSEPPSSSLSFPSPSLPIPTPSLSAGSAKENPASEGRGAISLLEAKEAGEAMIKTWNNHTTRHPARMKSTSTWLSEGRRERLLQCLEERHDFQTMWYQAIQKLPIGKDINAWNPTFDWMLDVTNIMKVLEGQYDKQQHGMKPL